MTKTDEYTAKIRSTAAPPPETRIGRIIRHMVAWIDREVDRADRAAGGPGVGRTQ